MKICTLKTATVIAAFCFSLISLTAQENSAIPAKNNFAIELNFKPFGENVISFNQLQLKYRLVDNWALRLGLSLDNKKFNQPGDDYEPLEEQKVTGKENSIEFGVLPGIEYHFLKNSKISPYVGVELLFSKRSVKSHYRDYTPESYYDNITGNYQTRYVPVEIDIEGATRSITVESISMPGYYSYYQKTEYINRAHTSYGGNLLLGCDFYFMRNLYVGLEAGLGYNYTQYQKVSIGVSSQVHPTIIPSYTESKLGFYYNSALRLGFWF